MFRKEKNRLTTLLNENPNAPLKTVLVNPDLSISLRNESPALFNYLFPENKDRTILNDLIDWALSDKKNKDSGDFIYNRNASNVFTCVSKKFHQKLYDDGTLSKRLFEFIDDESFNESPSFSGQFASILTQHARQTDFKLFKENPLFYRKILEHIQLLSYQRILIDIFSENADALSNKNPEKVVNDISKYAMKTDLKNEGISHGIFVAVDAIIKDSSEEVNDYFTKNEKFLTNMISAALQLKKSSVLIDAFRALETLFKQVEPTLKNQITNTQKIDFQKLKNEGQMLKAILYYPVFWKQGIEVMTDYFFQDLDKKSGLIPNSKFCFSYINVFKQMTFKERVEYADKLDLISKLNRFTNKVRFNGLIYKLIKALSKPPKKEEAGDLLDPESRNRFNSEPWELLVMKYTAYYDEFKIQKYKEVGFEKKKSSYY